MQEAQVSGVQLLKPGEDPAIVLDLVDEAFHQMNQDVLAKLLGIVAWVTCCCPPVSMNRKGLPALNLGAEPASAPAQWAAWPPFGGAPAAQGCAGPPCCQ